VSALSVAVGPAEVGRIFRWSGDQGGNCSKVNSLQGALGPRLMVGEIVHRERRGTSAGATFAWELNELALAG
jgi:hypothetical protein